LPLAAAILLSACETNGYSVSQLEQQYYAGCATSPPENPACGHH
jgi:hypothetical protein